MKRERYRTKGEEFRLIEKKIVSERERARKKGKDRIQMRSERKKYDYKKY